MAAPLNQTLLVLQALYNRAQAIDMEFTASSYWQARFQLDFPMADGFACLCEQSPDDDDRTRLDQIIYKVDSRSFLLFRVLIVESKRHGDGVSHIKKAEKQALAGSSAALMRHANLPFIYSITTWRTRFRVWILFRNQDQLTAADGGASSIADRTLYLDIISSHELYRQLILKIKGDISGLSPDSFPQSAPSWSAQSQEYAASSSAGPATESFPLGMASTSARPATEPFPAGMASSSAGPATEYFPTGVGMNPGEAWSSPPAQAAVPMGMASSSAGPATESFPTGMASSSARPATESFPTGVGMNPGEAWSSPPTQAGDPIWIEVHVKVERHRRSKDDWGFEDYRGRWKSIPRIDWKRRTVHNQAAWCWRKGDHYYYTYQNLSNS